MSYGFPLSLICISPLQSLFPAEFASPSKVSQVAKISVLFSVDGSDMPVAITYMIQMVDNIQVISCSVDQTEYKNRLQIGKFELRSRLSSGIYTPLFNEGIQGKSIVTSLFVDKVYADIMNKEKMPVDENFVL